MHTIKNTVRRLVCQFSEKMPSFSKMKTHMILFEIFYLGKISCLSKLHVKVEIFSFSPKAGNKSEFMCCIKNSNLLYATDSK